MMTKSLILVQNNQYVEPEIISEICSEMSSFIRTESQGSGMPVTGICWMYQVQLILFLHYKFIYAY